MSLVNDALRRAQDAQKKSQPAAPGPALRPAEPAVPEKRGMGMLALAIVAVAAIGGLIFILHGRQKKETRQTVAEARSPAPVVSEAKPAVQSTTAAPPAPVASVALAEKAPTPLASGPAPQLKLQAIFFAPGHSSAIISGKTVRAGDNFKGFRVAAITQTSATLVNATQTNVMTLESD